MLGSCASVPCGVQAGIWLLWVACLHHGAAAQRSTSNPAALPPSSHRPAPLHPPLPPPPQMLDILANIAIRAGDYRVAMQVRSAVGGWGGGRAGLGAQEPARELSAQVMIAGVGRSPARFHHPAACANLHPHPAALPTPGCACAGVDWARRGQGQVCRTG